MSDDFMTVREVAERLAIAEPTAYEWLRKGTIPGRLKFGRCVRVSRAALERWLKEQLAQADAASH